MSKKLMAVLSALVALTACGGGSNESSPFDVVAIDATQPPVIAADQGNSQTTSVAGVCVDTAPLNDGWGWNGLTGCQLPITQADPVSTPTVATPPAVAVPELTPEPEVTPGPGQESTVNHAYYSCKTINGNNQHTFTLWEDHRGELDWYIHGDSVWVATQSNNGIQHYGVTNEGLIGRNPQFDRGSDYIQNCMLQAGSGHQWLLNQMPNSLPSVTSLTDQWTYSCSLDADSSTNWTWVLNTDNKIYDLAGNQTGRWSWFSDGQFLQLNPFNNPSPQIRQDGKDLILADSRGGDYGKCIADKQIQPATLVGLFNYPMFHCHINGDQQYLLFAPSGQLLSQYGFNLGGWQKLGNNSYQFKDIIWTATDQGTIIGLNNDRLTEFCSQHSGRALYEI